jgi:hypothetical protein
VDGLIRELTETALTVMQPQRDGIGPTLRIRLAQESGNETVFLRYDETARLWIEMSDNEVASLGLDDPVCVNGFAEPNGVVGNQVFVGAGCGPVPPSQAPSTFAP